MYYRYIQRSEDGVWVPVNSDELDAKVEEHGAKKATILEVTELVDENTKRDRRTYKYRGPLYFDIDCKEDIQLALNSGKTLVDKIVSLGVPTNGVRIFASGSKGIHVTVDQRYFSVGRPIKGLPLVYKAMAKELYVPGMDFAVYSCGRGNAFRIPNVQRDDGNYRVPILYEELDSLTADGYQQMTSAPRKIDAIEPTPKQALQLKNMFEEARREVNNEATPQIIVSSNETLAKIRDDVPPCVEQLVSWRGIRAEKALNQVAVQLGVYISRVGVSEIVEDGLISRLADNSTSSKYNTLASRVQHVRGCVQYMKATESYHFSCPSMRSLLDRSPCEDCVIKDDPEAGNKGSLSMGLVERQDGMFIQGRNADKPLTNFTMTPTDHYIDIPKEGGGGRRVGTRMELLDKGELIATVVFNESSWLSRSAFMKDTTEGHGVLTFFGSDNDVQAIKGHVLRKENSMGEILRVHTSGVHREEIGDSEVFTYVEPDMSINTNKIQNTYEFSGSLVARPYFSESSICGTGDADADEALLNMLRMNQPAEIGLLVGWFSACHLKTHIMSVFNQFPILSVWGSAGSGKSVTVSLISWLNGTDYTMRDTPVNVSNITPYAVLDYASSTTTVPRVLEEYNKSKMRSSSFKAVGEVMKASWNGEVVLRGGLADKGTTTNTGAKVNKIPISGPLCVISEQELDMPALQERSVRVQLSKEKRKGRRGELREANRGRKKLREVGKALMAVSLQTTTRRVDDWMEETEDFLSEDIDDRPRYCYQVCLMGLKYLQHVTENHLKLPKSSEYLEHLVQNLQEHYLRLSASANDINAHSEVDAVMNEMCIMAAMQMSMNDSWLIEGQHYLADGDEGRLFLDTMICHAMYRKYMKQMSNTPPVIDNFKGLNDLLVDEPYFVEWKVIPSVANGRAMAVLDREALRQKGVDASNFFN